MCELERANARHGPARRGWTALGLVLCLALPGALAAQQGLEGLDAELGTWLRDFGLPGFALAVVQDDSVTFAAGFGERRVGSGEAVDEHTIFAVGSTSKAFTAAALAMLVDEDEVEWDDPVVDRLPGFRLSDPYITRDLRVRDLMIHNSGLLRGDRIWYSSGRTREDVLHQLRFQPVTFPLRSTFQYNNLTWIAAGELVEELTGQKWDDVVTARIFRPLGMSRSNTSVGPLKTMDNVATPHTLSPDGTLKPAPYRNIDNAGPAGSINSSALQMAQWVRLHLGGGAYGGQRIISEEAVKEMHTGQMLMRLDGSWGLLFPESNFLTYGMGWFLSDYRGLKLVSHGGNIDGMTAFVAFVPERGYGFVVLVNLDQANPFISGLTHRLIDRMEGGEQLPWKDNMLQAWSQARDRAAEGVRRREESRVAGTKPTLPAAAYAGTYHNDVYGDIEVTERGGGLFADFGAGFHGPLEHWHYDTFQAVWDDAGAGKELFRFEIGTDGTVEVLHAEIEGSIEFEKKEESGGS